MYPNLSKLGLKRLVPEPEADLITINKTPYPVLSRYKIWCNRIGVEPFAGGTFQQQGNIKPGFITSGFRDSHRDSPHEFGFAFDVHYDPDLDRQIWAARRALDLYPRIGLYPGHTFIHFDLAPEDWIQKYNGRHYWVKNIPKRQEYLNKKYMGFDNFEMAVDYAVAMMKTAA